MQWVANPSKNDHYRILRSGMITNSSSLRVPDFELCRGQGVAKVWLFQCTVTMT